jgi:hypothetical protein
VVDRPTLDSYNRSSWVIVSVRRLSVLTEIFRGLPQSLQANSRMIHQNRPLHSTFFPIHYSLIILSFDAMKSELLKAALNEPIIGLNKIQ